MAIEYIRGYHTMEVAIWQFTLVSCHIWWRMPKKDQKAKGKAIRTTVVELILL